MWFAPVSGGLWWVKDGKHGQRQQRRIEKRCGVFHCGGKETNCGLAGSAEDSRSFADQAAARSAPDTYTQADGLAQNSVYSVYQARDGTVWAGTLSGGVSMFSDGKFTNLHDRERAASNTVASILETSDGTMWFATPNGLSALAKDRWAT